MLDQAAVRQLNEVLRGSIESNDIAGGSLLLMKDGKEALYHEDGLADRETGRPIRRDSIFRLYSMTKPVTAAAVMMLMERGMLDLYEPVSRYLPGFKHQLVEEGGRLTHVERDMHMFDLLSMTSGLVYGGDHGAGRETAALFQELGRRLFSDSPMSTVEAMNRLGECKLAFQPGASWHYGTSADVLGAVVEVVSGMRFGEFLRTQLFEPLGMRDTGLWLPEDKRSRLVRTYEDNGHGDLNLYTGNHLGIIHQMDREPAFESGGAGLVSTIDDYAQFASMLMNEGYSDGVQLLKPGTVRYLTSAALNDEQQRRFEKAFPRLRGYSYGNLMRVSPALGKAGLFTGAGEYGWDGWLGAYFCNCPAERLTFLFMMQKKGAGTTHLTRRLRNIVLSSYS